MVRQASIFVHGSLFSFDHEMTTIQGSRRDTDVDCQRGKELQADSDGKQKNTSDISCSVGGLNFQTFFS
jgi:hypothetical protein